MICARGGLGVRSGFEEAVPLAGEPHPQDVLDAEQDDDSCIEAEDDTR
jgi:hypothetical protein